VTTPALPTPALPDVFLPYQVRLWQAVDAHQVVVVEKSRRTGFTWALGAIAAMRAASEAAAGGMDVLYMGYEKEMTREFIGYVGEFARLFQLAAQPMEEFVFTNPDKPEEAIGAFRVRFDSGFEDVALPSVARALRGKQGLVILDEAAFMDDLAEVLKAALALLIWGGKVIIVSTHNGDTNPFNVLVQDIRAGRLPYHLMRLTFDDAMEEGLYERVCLRKGETPTEAGKVAFRDGILAAYKQNADEELHVIPNPSSGGVLPLTLIEARQDRSIPVLHLECPKDFLQTSEAMQQAFLRDWMRQHLDPLLAALDQDRPHVFGLDFARVRDLSVLWPLELGRDLVRRTPFLIEMRNVPHDEQRQVVFHVGDRLPRFRHAKFDAGGNGSALAEAAVRRWGETRVEAVQLSEPWYREHMPHFKAAFEDATITVPAEEGVQEDLRSLQWIRGVIRVPDRRRQGEMGPRHGDAAIAGGLAVAASRAEPEEYGYRPIALPALIAAERDGSRRRMRDRPARDAAEDRANTMRGRRLRGGIP
jgi:phage FluMu gp28-like protein